MFTDADVFAGNGFMSDAGWFIARGANELNLASVQRGFFGDDAAVGRFDGGFGMAFDFVYAFDDDFAGGGHGGQNFALFAAIFAAEDNDGIALFDMQFNE